MSEVWSYQVFELGGTFSGPKPGELEAMLNEMAQEGWELDEVVVRANTARLWVVLRRKQRRAPRRRSRDWPG